jgi:WS/DGAT/MGAT family acyltransferase
MRDRTYVEMMSSSDALIWDIERDPLLRSTVSTVWLLDAPPTHARMRRTVERMVAELPRLRQRVEPGRPRPRWTSADRFDVADHYCYYDLGGDADLPDLLAIAEEWIATEFDRRRPLWQLGVFSGVRGGRGALVLKVHHSIADGIKLMHMLSALADLEPDPAPRPAPAEVVAIERRARGPSLRAVREIAHRSTRRTLSIARQPVHSVRSAVSIAKLVMPTMTPLSSLMATRSNELRLDVRAVELEALRVAGKSVGGSLNDAFVSLVLDAVHRYHVTQGAACDMVRVHMPINVRQLTHERRGGNQFVPARTVMALGGGDVRQRLRRVSAHLAELRAEPALPHLNTISAAIRRLGVAISRRIIGGMLKGVDVLASNVPGPPCPVFLAGQRVEEFYAFGPPCGAALNVTLFSYDGVVHLGVTTDASGVTAREHFLMCLDEAIAEMIGTPLTHRTLVATA